MSPFNTSRGACTRIGESETRAATDRCCCFGGVRHKCVAPPRLRSYPRSLALSPRCRLRGKTDYPAEGMPDCCTPATPPTCPFHSSWRSAGYFSDHMNWLFIYCDPDILEHSNGRLAHCEGGRELGVCA